MVYSSLALPLYITDEELTSGGYYEEKPPRPLPFIDADDEKQYNIKRDGILQVPCKGRYPLNKVGKVMKAEARMKHVDDNDTILRIDDVNFPDFWLEVDIGEFINKKSIINSVVGNGNVFAGGVIFGDKPKTI